MSESSSNAARMPRDVTEEDGWCLEKRSWAFHRSAFRALGRPMAFGEYTYIRRQIGWGKAELLQFGSRDRLYRTRLPDGTVLDVLVLTTKAKKGKKVWHQMTRAIRPGDKRQGVAVPVSPKPAPAPPEPVPPPELVPAPILRTPLLTLGPNSARAAEVLAARLQPKPAPPRLASTPAPKSAPTKARRKV
jgi:hypothetical protein